MDYHQISPQPSSGYKQINKPMAFGWFITSDGTESN